MAIVSKGVATPLDPCICKASLAGGFAAAAAMLLLCLLPDQVLMAGHNVQRLEGAMHYI